MTARIWTADEAKEKLEELIRLAANGDAQVVTDKGGAEVILVSKRIVDRLEPSLKMALLTGGFVGDEETDMKQVLQDIRGGKPENDSDT